MPTFVLAFIAAQTAAAAALFPRVESLAAIRFRAFVASILSCVVQRDRCYANKLYHVRDTPRPIGLIPRLSLANRFSKCVPEPQN